MEGGGSREEEEERGNPLRCPPALMLNGPLIVR